MMFENDQLFTIEDGLVSRQREILKKFESWARHTPVENRIRGKAGYPINDSSEEISRVMKEFIDITNLRKSIWEVEHRAKIVEGK